VRFIADQIIRYGKVQHSGRPYLGIGNFGEVNAAIAAQYGLGADNGILIGRVQKGGPADRAGIRAGDVLVSLNGQATLSEAAFDSVLASLKPKQTVKATVVRPDGKSRTVTIHLGELPVSAS
jgi:S1-C subfamily serine protease